MSKLTVQDLLQKFVENNGEGVTSDEVRPFLADSDPLNQRIALELMYNITEDARYLINCVSVIKDDVEALWEFLFDYTSELKDPYVITILMMEGLRYLDPIKDSEKVEKIIYNWKIVNPVMENLPDNARNALKVKNVYELSLTPIAKTFVNWMLAGIKYKDYYEFDYFPYYLINHAKLKYVFPKEIFDAVESLPEEHLVHFNKAILHVFQYDIESANESFILAAKALLKLNDVAQAYNIMTLWYKKAGFILDKTPQLLLDLQQAAYEIVEKALDIYSEQAEIVIMTTYLYAEIATALHKLGKLDYETLMLLSSRYENQVRSYKRKYSINYPVKAVKKDRLNIAFVSQYMSKNAINSQTFDFMKYHDKEKFNVFFYDCGLNPLLSSSYKDEFSQYATIRSYEETYQGDKIKNILELSDQMVDDSIDVVIYTDWLYNVIGHFLCSLQPAPLIISSNMDAVSTGLKSIPYSFDYLGVSEYRVRHNPEKMLKVAPLFADLCEDQPSASREIFEIPEDSVVLYASNYLKYIEQDEFLALVSSILLNNPLAHFTFSGLGDPDNVLAYFDDKELSEKVTYLGNIDTSKKFMSFVKMADVYLHTSPGAHLSELYSVMVASKPLLMLSECNEKSCNELEKAVVDLDDCILKTYDEYIEKANSLINSLELRVELGNSLKQRYNKELDFNVALKQTEDTILNLYNELCD